MISRSEFYFGVTIYIIVRLKSFTSVTPCSLVGVNVEKAKFLLVDIPLFSKILNEYNAYTWLILHVLKFSARTGFYKI